MAEIQGIALLAHLPVWEINMNQAARHVWLEVIHIATLEKKIEQLLEIIVQDYGYGTNHEIADLNEKVREWARSLKPGV